MRAQSQTGAEAKLPGIPDLKVSVRQVFGIDTDLEVPAYAQADEQIAALRALGTDPVRKLVLPRILAGLVMVPLLTVVSGGVGMVGAWIVTLLLNLRATISQRNARAGHLFDGLLAQS